MRLRAPINVMPEDNMRLIRKATATGREKSGRAAWSLHEPTVVQFEGLRTAGRAEVNGLLRFLRVGSLEDVSLKYCSEIRLISRARIIRSGRTG